MDCKTVLRMLESCRPTGDDLAQSELAPVAVHLEECTECLGQFRARQLLDGQIATSIQAVPVPAGLRERIHSRLDRTTRRHLRLRPSLWTGVAAAAAILIAAAGICFWPHENDSIVAINIMEFGQSDLAILEANEIEDSRSVPSSIGDALALSSWCDKQIRQLKVRAKPSTRWPIQNLNAIGRTNIKGRAVAVFQYTDSNGSSDLLALPSSHFNVTGMKAGTMLLHRTRSNYVVVAWQEAGTTYVAVLKGWPPEEWRRLLAPTGGMT